MLAVMPVSPARSSSVSKCAHSFLSGVASDKNDQSGILLLHRELQEVVAIARDHEQVVLGGVRECVSVTGSYRKCRTKADDRVTFRFEDAGRFLGNVVVQEEPHAGSGGLICRATSVSISAR